MPKLRFDLTKSARFSSPLETPTYSVQEAARYLRMPANTLRDWVVGGVYRTRDGVRHRTKPLIELADIDGRLLSFWNLAEAHVLGALRRQHGVTFHNIRKALDFVAKHHDWRRPLLEQQFATDGARLFVEHLGKLVDASAQGQVMMREMLTTYLQRLERNGQGVFRLYPFTRPVIDAQSPMTVFIDPTVAFGRPVLGSVRIPTAALVERYLAGEAMEELARDYACTTLDVQEAIRVEWLDTAA